MAHKPSLVPRPTGYGSGALAHMCGALGGRGSGKMNFVLARTVAVLRQQGKQHCLYQSPCTID